MMWVWAGARCTMSYLPGPGTAATGPAAARSVVFEAVDAALDMDVARPYAGALDTLPVHGLGGGSANSGVGKGVSRRCTLPRWTT